MAVSIFMRWPQYIKIAYSHAESFRKWERFLKTTASLSNLIPPCFCYLTNLVSGSYSPVVIKPRSIYLRKWPKRYRTAPSPMADFGHYLAKNHATKNVIKPKWVPWARAQYGRTAWLSTTVWSFAGIPTRQVMFFAFTSSSTWKLMMIWWQYELLGVRAYPWIMR